MGLLGGVSPTQQLVLALYREPGIRPILEAGALDVLTSVNTLFDWSGPWPYPGEELFVFCSELVTVSLSFWT